jgi:hypothetical protein
MLGLTMRRWEALRGAASAAAVLQHTRRCKEQRTKRGTHGTHGTLLRLDNGCLLVAAASFAVPSSAC